MNKSSFVYSRIPQHKIFPNVVLKHEFLVSCFKLFVFKSKFLKVAASNTNVSKFGGGGGGI